MTRALAMVSGGLDSILAAKLIKDQGIEVIGICFKSYFFNEENAKRMCKQIDMPLEVVDFSEEHFEMVKDPKHGRGKNMNPCIDCHAMMMRYSGELLKKFDADFIITGEVLNQRPMSQNRQALNKVTKESGFKEKILRPLCAKNLDETQMEKDGLVDREKLLVINHDREKLKPLVNISGENIIICYADIVIPKSAVEIERKNGIIYYFQTTEKCHEFNPHIHAKYQGEKVSVYLKTLKIDGKMKNKKKLKEIVGYVMKHREELLEKWKKYCVR